jgi:hypothetical protein
MTDSEISIRVGEFRRRLLEYSAGRGPDPRKNLHLDFVEADMDRHLEQPRLVRANVTAKGTPRDRDDVLEVAGFDRPDVPAGLNKVRSSTGPVRSIKPADTTSGCETVPRRRGNSADRTVGSNRAKAYGSVLWATVPTDARDHRSGCERFSGVADTAGVDSGYGEHRDGDQWILQDPSTQGESSTEMTSRGKETMSTKRVEVKHYDIVDTSTSDNRLKSSTDAVMNRR